MLNNKLIMKKILNLISIFFLAVGSLMAQSAIENPEIQDSVLIIPEGTTEIPNWKYRGQTDFSGVVLPSSLTRIGENAFRETNLKTVVIPEGVQQVGLRAFYQCTELEEVAFPSTVDTIPYACFTGAEKLSKVIINEGVQGIGEYAFNNCVSITEITIPGSVKKISDMAFRACSGLTQLTLEDGIEEIGREAFSSCSNLQSVVIPESVKTIGYMAFSKKTTLIVVAGSEAHKYAVENGYQFEAVGNGELNLEETTLTVDKLLNDSEFLHLANIQTPQSGKVFAIGDEGPAGGIIFYANAANNTYLEVKLIDGTYNWNDAKQAAVNENCGGFSDWRLPLPEELNLIYNMKDIINIDFGTARYWTSARDGVKNSPYVWFVDFADGKSYHNSSAGLSALQRVALVRTVSENLVVESDGDRYELSPYVGQWNHTDALVVAEAYSQLTGEEWSLPTVTQMQKLQSCFSEPHFSKYWMHNGNSETASYYDATKGTYGKIASEKLENVRLIKVANASNVSDYVYLNLQTHWNQNGDYRLAFTDDTYMGCGNLAIAQILLYHKLLPKNMQIDLSKVENELKENTPQENKLETSRYIYAVSSKKVVENFDVERTVYEYPKRTTQWEMEQLIVNELSASRPMMIHCYNAAKTSDHAMVVDGARHVGDKLQVHLLFGWNGDYDGWFYLREPINTTMINLDNEYRGIETYVPKAQNENQTSVTEQITNIHIYTYGKTIIVENASDEIFVYDVMGRLVCRDATPCVRAELRMNDVGVYVVKIGNFAKKIVVD